MRRRVTTAPSGRAVLWGAAVGFVVITSAMTALGYSAGAGVGGAFGMGFFVGIMGGCGGGAVMGATLSCARTEAVQTAVAADDAREPMSLGVVGQHAAPDSLVA